MRRICGRTAASAASPVCPLPLCGISRLFAAFRRFGRCSALWAQAGHNPAFVCHKGPISPAAAQGGEGERCRKMRDAGPRRTVPGKGRTSSPSAGPKRGVSGKTEKTASLRRKEEENRRLQRRILAAESGPARPINLPGTAKRRFLRLLDLQFAGQDCPNRKERAPHWQPPEGSFSLDLCAKDDPRCGALFSRAAGQ